MLETSARLLKLLSLLQTHRDWPGAELAGRLGVTTRTLRRDVGRLRELGYPVHASQGSAGYRLGAGSSLPPLLLDDDEAVAVAVGLRTSAGSSVSGIEEISLRALSKLEQVLPSRLRHRVRALQRSTLRVGGTGPAVSAEVLMVLADACTRRMRLSFDYASAQGSRTRRTVEPHGVVNFNRHWYLVAWDTGRADWRSFRVDRLTPRTPLGAAFARRELPHGDLAAYLSHQLSSQAWPVRATVLLHEPAHLVSQRIWPGMGTIEPVDERSCLLRLGAETIPALVWMVTSVDCDFTLTDGPAGLAEAFHAQARRCLAAVPPTSPPEIL